MPTADGVGAAGWLAGHDEPFRERFEHLLTTAPTRRDYAAGFLMAQDTGLPAVPMLWEMLLAERSNVDRRTAVLAAATLAGGAALDELLFEWLGQQKAIKEERTMVALAIALGPPRERGVATFWSHGLGPARTPEEILAIAVRLAAARMPDAVKGAPVLGSDEVGLAAATAYAGLPVSEPLAGRFWDLREIGRHDELFWRGALLAGVRQLEAGGECDARLLQRAQSIAELTGDPFAAAREVAARLRALKGDVECTGPRPDSRILWQLACDRASAQRVAAWLGPVPLPRDETPGRLAVSYVLSRDVAEVVAQRDAWAGDGRVNRHVAVALAWRLLGEPGATIADVTVAQLPEWQLARWAGGQGLEAQGADDPVLDAAIGLAAAGRLPRPAARAMLEETLWRWGSHPALGRLAAEQRLVRDLLLVGSNNGGKYVDHVPFEQRYRPKGIAHGSAFFDIAVDYYDFVTTRRPPLPPQYRLR